MEYCMQCGNKIKKGDGFCQSCGHKTGTSSIVSTSASPTILRKDEHGVGQIATEPNNTNAFWILMGIGLLVILIQFFSSGNSSFWGLLGMIVGGLAISKLVAYIFSAVTKEKSERRKKITWAIVFIIGSIITLVNTLARIDRNPPNQSLITDPTPVVTTQSTTSQTLNYPTGSTASITIEEAKGVYKKVYSKDSTFIQPYNMNGYNYILGADIATNTFDGPTLSVLREAIGTWAEIYSKKTECMANCFEENEIIRDGAGVPLYFYYTIFNGGNRMGSVYFRLISLQDYVEYEISVFNGYSRPVDTNNISLSANMTTDSIPYRILFEKMMLSKQRQI